MRQFLSQYKRVKDLQGDELLWGDEIEYGIFCVDKDQKEIRLSLRAKEVSWLRGTIRDDGSLSLIFIYTCLT